MEPQEYYKRIAGILEPGRLRSKRVAVIGLGSGGSRIAAELGRLGLELLLVERAQERLEEHNLVRHLLGYPSLGRPKLEEMLSHLRTLNPSIAVSACALDVVDETARLRQRLQEWRPDVLAVCTDNEQSKHALNQVAVELAVPQVGAGVYDGGIGGEAWRIRPGQACYGCIATQLQLQRHSPKPRSPPDYNHFDPQEVPSTCALGLDIEQIAILQCRMLLELLAQDSACSVGVGPEVNLWVFSNRLVPGTFTRPLHCEFFSVPRRADCLVCGKALGDFDAEAGRILAAVRGRSAARRSRPSSKAPARGKRRQRAIAPRAAAAQVRRRLQSAAANA